MRSIKKYSNTILPRVFRVKSEDDFQERQIKCVRLAWKLTRSHPIENL